MQPFLNAIGIVSERALHAIAFAFAFSIISYLHIVIGELAPKSMAIRLSDQVGIWTAAPLYAFYWLMFPAIWFLNTSANWVLRKVGLDVARAHDSHYSAEELKLILRSSRADPNFTTEEWRVLAQALDFRDLEVSDLMRPFREAITLSEGDDVAANLAASRSTGTAGIRIWTTTAASRASSTSRICFLHRATALCLHNSAC